MRTNQIFGVVLVLAAVGIGVPVAMATQYCPDGDCRANPPPDRTETGARAAPVPCSQAGKDRYNCNWYLADGAPVIGKDGKTVVGRLHKGTNWVVCQEQGRQEKSGGYFNRWWAYTLADNNQWGWVNAVWASGGDNNGRFDGVPHCQGRYGSPPSSVDLGSAPMVEAPPPPETGCSEIKKSTIKLAGTATHMHRTTRIDLSGHVNQWDVPTMGPLDLGTNTIHIKTCKRPSDGQWYLHEYAVEHVHNDLQLTLIGDKVRMSPAPVKSGTDPKAVGYGVFIRSVDADTHTIAVEPTICMEKADLMRDLKVTGNLLTSVPYPFKSPWAGVGMLVMNKALFQVPAAKFHCATFGEGLLHIPLQLFATTGAVTLKDPAEEYSRSTRTPYEVDCVECRSHMTSLDREIAIRQATP